MRQVSSYLTRFSAFLTAALLSAPAFAESPPAGSMYFQEAASPVMERITHFHNGLLVLITAISLFVLGLLIYVAVRFSEKKNPVPATFTHNIKLEVIWTAIPTLIVFGLLFWSLPLLYYSDRFEKPDMTLKVTGYQWYWGYEYPDYEGLTFLSNMIPDKDIQPGQRRNLSVDNVVVLPVDTNIQILVTASDVLHAFAVPAFGIKKDAVPGRLNETWVRITKPGVYYGQCSELCGKNHGFMPIEIHAVSKEEFEAWLIQAKEKFAAAQPAGAYQIAMIKE